MILTSIHQFTPNTVYGQHSTQGNNSLFICIGNHPYDGINSTIVHKSILEYVNEVNSRIQLHTSNTTQVRMMVIEPERTMPPERGLRQLFDHYWIDACIALEEYPSWLYTAQLCTDNHIPLILIRNRRDPVITTSDYIFTLRHKNHGSLSQLATEAIHLIVNAIGNKSLHGSYNSHIRNELEQALHNSSYPWKQCDVLIDGRSG